MSTLDNPKNLFKSNCSTNSEPYALQNLGDMMEPEFSENCIIIIDPSMPIHHKAYVIIDSMMSSIFDNTLKRMDGNC
jgi:hypothetical protein